MDIKRKKQLIEEYENRKPEMGVISFCCIATGEAFYGVSKDTKADFNSNHFKLNANWHPNMRLLELWKQYGENGFELSVVQVLEYEDKSTDHSAELEKMLIQCLESNGTARRIWK